MTLNDRRRAGFSVLEMVVALAVSGLILLGARALLEHLGDGSVRFAVFASETDGAANAERLLRELVGRIDADASSGETFTGGETEARFTTWCDVPAGWQERCVITLALDTLDNRAVLLARDSAGAAVILRRGFRYGTLRYLREAGNGGSWLRVWGAGVTTPLAIGVVLDADTLILRIGERG